MKKKMKKLLILLIKLPLVMVVVLWVSAATQANAQSNSHAIANDEIIYFGSFPISGSIFNAIDPRYLANRNGFSIRVFQGGRKRKSFNLNTFNDPFFHRNPLCELCNTCALCGTVDEFSMERLGAVLSWNYSINGIPLMYDSRALVSALMLQAIEKVTFTPVSVDSANFVPNHILRIVRTDGMDKETGRVRIYTRNIPHTVSDKNTLYLLDGVVITPRIFEAIRPIYIKSLERITDKDALQRFNQSDLQEVVKVETFTNLEGLIIVNTGRFILLVDGIELPSTTKHKLNRDFFKKQQSILSGDEGFDALERKFPGERSFTTITLVNH